MLSSHRPWLCRVFFFHLAVKRPLQYNGWWNFFLCDLDEERHHLGSLGGGKEGPKRFSVAGLAALSVISETCFFHTTKLWLHKQHNLLLPHLEHLQAWSILLGLLFYFQRVNVQHAEKHVAPLAHREPFISVIGCGQIPLSFFVVQLAGFLISCLFFGHYFDVPQW